MIKQSVWLLASLFFSALVNASELHLDDTYEVFGGKPVSLKSLIGKKPVYIKFWATWCLDCRRELPHLQQTYEKYHNQITMLAVNLNINETNEYILRLQQKNNLTIPIVMDNNGSIAGNFQFQGTPFHVLLDAKGNLVYTTYKDDETLLKHIDQLAKNGKITHADATTQAPASDQIVSLPKGTALVYLSATWCDWYMKEIHPEMASNCINATRLMNELYKQQPNISLNAYVTHLWTEAKDLADYTKKFSIRYPVSIDINNQVSRHHQAAQYPTLLVFKEGKEIGRFTQFDNPTQMLADVKALLAKK